MSAISTFVTGGKRIITKKPELLAPAGSLEKLKIAIHYGADAVFIGGQEFGLRSNADNFSLEEMAEGVEFAEKYGAKIYVTTNIFAHNENIDGLERYLIDLQKVGIKGIIVADPLIIETCKRVAPQIELHLSTQTSLTNWQAVKFWQEEGLERVVLARELSITEIIEIKNKVDIEIETFIHGAMCIAYSGRCVLSNHMTARDSNRGGCCQSCRWEYGLYKEDAQFANIANCQQFIENNVPFTMNPKDLSLLSRIPQLIEAGVDSLKIEGRMKSIHYVATVTSVYRAVIDQYCADPDNFVLEQKWLEELDKCASRQTALGFFESVPTYKEQMFNNETKESNYDFAGLVLDYDIETNIVTLEQRNYFAPGDEIEFFGPEIDNFKRTITQIWDEDGNELDAARHPQQIVKFKIDKRLYPNNMMRKQRPL